MIIVPPQNIKQGDLILDVRTPAELAEIRLDMPFFAVELGKLDPKQFIKEHKLDGKKRLHILCRSGRRATMAAEMFQNSGFENVAVIEGGMENAKNFLPVIKSNRMSIERQVRIAAGSLVVIGVVLGECVHRAFYILPFFVGSMLIFAGITNWCGMGIILSHMPWNKI